MRQVETILKLLFLLGAVFFISTWNIDHDLFIVFLVVKLLLGIVLIFNKEASYNFKQTKRDLAIRKTEGIIMVVSSVAILIITNCYA